MRKVCWQSNGVSVDFLGSLGLHTGPRKQPGGQGTQFLGGSWCGQPLPPGLPWQETKSARCWEMHVRVEDSWVALHQKVLLGSEARPPRAPWVWWTGVSSSDVPEAVDASLPSACSGAGTGGPMEGKGG